MACSSCHENYGVCIGSADCDGKRYSGCPAICRQCTIWVERRAVICTCEGNYGNINISSSWHIHRYAVCACTGCNGICNKYPVAWHPFPTLILYLVVHDKEGLDETEGLGVPAISTSAITTSNSLEPRVVIDTVVGGLVKEPEKTDESTVIANLYSPHTGIPTMLGAAV